MGTYTTSIEPGFAIHYRDLLKLEDCVFKIPDYTFFQAKSKNWQITFYRSGKVVVQGRAIDEIVSKLFGKNPVQTGEIAPYPHLGTDESGKGDFFGALVVAGCYLNEENACKLKALGAADSKTLDDKKILNLAQKIKECSVYDIVTICNKKYNELYSKFRNLNRLLAWAHGTVIENILNKTVCSIGVSDKFGDESLILSALKEKGKGIKLIQQPKAEKDTAVACASILARAAYCENISKMCYEYDFNFPKGAGTKVLEAGRNFVQKFGAKELKNVSKTHFKTFEDIIH